MDLKAVIAGVSFALMWSSAFTSARIVVQDASPLAVLSVRFLISVQIAELLVNRGLLAKQKAA